MRYPVSGANTAAITPATASSRQSIGVSITAGRVFWLRGVWTTPNATTGPVLIMDATVGSTATGSVLAIALSREAASATVWEGPPIRDTIHTFGVPGIKFATNPVACLEASGSIPIGHIGCFGYEE